ncbi:hypothetical protein J1N35_034345 [Gossypium stocksii]|uniref:DUF4283 domain-containing protein n=1 Tax=Gossypium stocksii TaxID=47602 RepID=A0A9D3URV4_9ROSI|nr:hypothetical protein J1N35_034345 [Gossypium stocksii]
MEGDLAKLNILDEEEEAFTEEVSVVDQSYQLFLAGRCLTDSVVHFPSLCNTMADLWHPIKGICTTDLGEKRFLFQCFHEVDVQRIQVHDLPPGMMTVTMAKQFGDVLGRFLENEIDVGQNSERLMAIKSLNQNSIGRELGYNISFNRDINWHDLGHTMQSGIGNDGGPMELVLAEENDPLTILEGKKSNGL